MSDYPLPPPFGGGFRAYGTSAPSMQLTSANLPGLDQYAYQQLQPTSHNTINSYNNHYTNVEPFNSNQNIDTSGNLMSSTSKLDQASNMAFSHFQPSSRPMLASPKFSQSTQKPLTNKPSTTQSVNTRKPQATSSALNSPAKATIGAEHADQPPLMEMSDLEDGELGEDDTVSYEILPQDKLPGPPRQIMTPRSSRRMKNGLSMDEEKRQQAKEALQLCYQRGLGYVHFVREGIDWILLRDLYAEIGVHVSSDDLAAAKELIGKRTQVSDADRLEALNPTITFPRNGESKRAEPMVGKAQPSKSSSLQNGSLQPATLMDGLKASGPAANGVLQSVPGVQEESTPILHSSVPLAKVAPTATKASDKSYDRKDHIARMLAARTVKSSSNPDIASPTSPAAPSSTKISQPNSKPDVPVSIGQAGQADPVETQIKPGTENPKQKITDSQDTSTNLAAKKQIQGDAANQSSKVATESSRATDLEAKKRAQTELARRKMEALMNRNNNRTQQAATSKAPEPSKQRSPTAIEAAMASQKPSPAIEIPAAPQAPPIPHSSFFSPTPGRQFSLPGLFMPPAPLVTPIKDGVQGNANTQDKASLSSNVPQQVLAESATSIILPSDLGLVTENKGDPKLHVTEPAHVVSPATEIVNRTRKRQKAADFIDPPATRVKRMMGQGGDQSVVIEVSDDEALDGFLDDVEMAVESGQEMYGFEYNKLTGTPNGQLCNTSNTHIQRELPAATHTQIVTGAMTPLAIQPLDKASDGLKSKEMEIELMKRRIAEVEQRRKAKQIGSRAPTPTASRLPIASKPNRASSEIIETSKPSATPENETTKSEDPARSPEVTHAADPHHELINQERLLAQQLSVDVEQQPSHELSQRPHPEPEEEQYRQRPPQSEAETVHNRSNSSQGSLELPTFTTLSNQASQELTNQQALPPEVTNGMQLGDQNPNDHLPSQSVTTSDPENNHSAFFTAEDAGQKQNSQRRAAIEAGLPILDAEVAKTEQKLQYLRNQIQELEAELERGITGRRALVEELRELSSDSVKTSGLTASAKVVDSVLESGGSNDMSSGFAAKSTEASSPLLNLDTSIPAAVDKSLPASTAGSKCNLPGSSSDSTSNSAIEEDVMDISRSDLDEGEISEDEPQNPSHPQSTASPSDGEDIYEPPVIIDMDQNSTSTSLNPQRHPSILQDDTQPMSSPPPVTQPEKLTKELNPEESIVSCSTNQTETHTKKIDTDPVSTDPGGEADESDGYEPPEPVSPTEPTNMDNEIVPQDTQIDPPSPTHQRPMPVTVSTTPATTTVVDPQPESLTEVPTKLEHKLSHFTPYESPLRQFKSYRYHRSFPFNVADGFRSLTYSHDIKPEEPICPFEIGGTCNDQSCPYQHFRNMSLSDNMILVQLGATPEGLAPEEQNAYKEGLKNLIRDIRSRNVRDFNAMAADITTYRANFIGDSTRILPL